MKIFLTLPVVLLFLPTTASTPVAAGLEETVQEGRLLEGDKVALGDVAAIGERDSSGRCVYPPHGIAIVGATLSGLREMPRHVRFTSDEASCEMVVTDIRY